MTKSQIFKKEYALELIKIAEGDYETAQVLLAAQKGRKENICFNAQQVIEKSVKAILCHLELPVPFTHNIDILLDKIPKELHIPASEHFNELTEYATIRRYEEGVFELDQQDLETSLNVAHKALKWAKDIISNN